MLSLFGGVFLGWSLGANDASNIFGTAVSSKMVRFWHAAFLAALFCVLGALISGDAGIETLQRLTTLNINQAVISSVSAAITVTIMTILGLPVSTSQSVVGAIIGMGILNSQINGSGLGKVIICWFGTPVGGLLVTLFLYKILAWFYNNYPVSLFNSDRLLRVALILSSAYGAYALGANNVANVTAVFVAAGMVSINTAALVGGLSIALGILTYSKPVVATVGRKLVKLDPFSALIVSLALAITIHIYTIIGVPISSSQAVIGSVLGIGLIKGARTVSLKTLKRIVVAWFFTPMVACLVALSITFISRLQYISPM